jgi:hypothetical protein
MSLRDRIEHIKAKPEHVREQIALGASAGVALVVFLGWAVALVSSGTFAFDDVERPAAPSRVTDAGNNFAGAAAAFSSAFSSEEEGTLTAVETHTSSTLDQSDTSDATVIPF